MKFNFRINAAGAAVAMLLAGASTCVLAGNITGVKVEPANAVAGAPVKVTVAGTDEGICGLRVEYGNGDVDVTKMNKGKDDFPRSFMKTYNNAGTYTIIAKGGRDGSTFGCTGETSTKVVVAEAPKPKPMAPPVAAGTAAGTMAAPTRQSPNCPEGYNLIAKSVNNNTGAFTCAASKGAKRPDMSLPCPTGTVYFANSKSAMLGCRTPRAPAKR